MKRGAQCAVISPTPKRRLLHRRTATMKLSFKFASHSLDDSSEDAEAEAVKREDVELVAMESDEVNYVINLDHVGVDERDETSGKVDEKERRDEEAGEEDDAVVKEDDTRDEGFRGIADSADCVVGDDDDVKSKVVIDYAPDSHSAEDDASDRPIERVVFNDLVDYDGPIERVGSNISMDSECLIQTKVGEISHKLETVMLDRIAAIDLVRKLLETELENGKIMYCAHFIYIFYNFD
jgi:hypothetical protein